MASLCKGGVALAAVCAECANSLCFHGPDMPVENNMFSH